MHMDGGEATGPIVAPSSSSSDSVGRAVPSCGGGVVCPHSSRPRARRVGAHPAALESISADFGAAVESDANQNQSGFRSAAEFILDSECQ